MLLISIVMITFVQTRPYSQLTSRLPPVGYANGFVDRVVKEIFRLLVGLGRFELG